MRILSLLPAATEIVYLLGLEKNLVGVSHECDFPLEVKSKPKVTFSEVSNSMNSREIDEKVKKIGHRGPGVFHIKEGVLKKLKPNLILTQELCEVCALTPSVILRSEATKDLKFKKAKSRDSSRIAQNDNLTVISLEPESVEDILDNIRVVGEAVPAGRQVGGRQKEAIRVIRGLKKRLEKVQKRLLRYARNDGGRPKVLIIEWLDPIMVAGHWIPEMVKLAGGRHLIAKAGGRSKIVSIDQIRSAKVDILVISPCGFDIDRTIQERFKINDLRFKIKNKKLRTYLIDGNAYMTRPGPRIIDGLEILAEILHPEIFPRKHSTADWREYI